MFHPRLQRLTALGLLVAYLAAGTAGGLLHDHDEALPCGRAEHSSHDHDSTALSIVSGEDDAAHDDDCTICRFLGQRSLSSEIRPLETSCELSVELALSFASQPVFSIARTTHSRAPPLFA